jgi:hypothetical protein
MMERILLAEAAAARMSNVDMQCIQNFGGETCRAVVGAAQFRGCPWQLKTVMSHIGNT